MRILARWAKYVPAANIHVLTVPGSADSPAVAWTRLAGLIGVDHTRYPVPRARVNRSMGPVSANLLRRLNGHQLVKLADWPTYARSIKQNLAGDVLVGRESARLAAPADAVPWIEARSREMVRGIRAAGYHVVGDLAELECRPQPRPDADAVSTEDILDAAVDVIARLQLPQWETR